MKCPTYHVFFKNLANPLRVNIISLLKCREMNVNELVKELKEEQSKVSHALAALNHCNIVLSRQSGKNKIYSLNKKTILPLLKCVDSHECGICKR